MAAATSVMMARRADAARVLVVFDRIICAWCVKLGLPSSSAN
jgi:hypothetical protein